MGAVNIKQKAHDLIDRLPEGATLEDLQYHIYVMEKIERGLTDVDEGRTISHEDAKKRLSKWLRN